MSKYETLFFSILIILSIFLRFSDLGYSHFYGDEAKALYLRKDVSAQDFLLNQRKGPVQFVAAWAMEKLTGSFNETTTRLPFVVAGVLSVVIFYFLVRTLFGTQVALYSGYLFSLSGFNIAFSRTVQYQSFLILFGLLAIYFMLLFYQKRNRAFLFLSSISMGLTFLSHYDAVFFLLPTIVILGLHVKDTKKFSAVLLFILPLVLMLLPFYFPYTSQGYFAQNTQNYLTKRIVGNEYLPSNSIYTFKIYNPFYIMFGLLLFCLLGLAGGFSWKKLLLVLWFALPFTVFELFFLNPGTHIHNYLIPLMVLVGLGLVHLSKYFVAALIAALFIIQTIIYIPRFSINYPWKANVNRSYNLYLYGFPYNRGWDQVREYLSAKQGVRNFYTNDNPNVAAYYLNKYDIAPPGPNFLPQYYVYVFDNQEFRYPDEVFMRSYALEKSFTLDNKVVLNLFSLKKTN